MSHHSTVEIPPAAGEPPLPEPPPPRRRRWLWIVIAAAAVVVVAIPLAVYALVGHGPGPSTEGQPTAAPSAEATATTGPTAAPTNGQPTGPAATGGIPRDELVNGTFDIPAWPADAPWPETAKMIHQVRFTNGRSATGPDGGVVLIGKSAYVDVNHDGTLETLAIISEGGQGFMNQVAVFTRNKSGAIVPFGQVLVTHPNGPWGVVKLIDDLRPAGRGGVALLVGDDYPCCGTTRDTVQFQWRTYAYNGAGFTQVDGPTAFGVDTRFPDLALSGPTTVTLGAPINGVRHGVLTLRVSAHGKVAASKMNIAIRIPGDAGLTPEGSGWTGFTSNSFMQGGKTWEGIRPAPAPGQSVTLQLGVSRPVTQDTATSGLSAHVSPLGADGNLTKDGWSIDNGVDVGVVDTG